MFIKIFKSNSPFLIIMLFLFGISLWIDGFVFYKQADIDITPYAIIPLYNIILNMVYYPFLKVLIAFLLVFVQAIILNSIISNSNLTIKNTYLPGLFYILLLSYYHNVLTLHPIIFVNFFIIVILDNIFKIYDKEHAFREIYNIGLLIAISSLFYFPSILFIVVLWLSFIIYRLFSWREWFISIIGIATPYLFIISYFFLIGKHNYFINKYDDLLFVSETINFKNNTYLLVFLIYIAVLSFLSISSTLLRINEKVIQERKHFAVIMWILIIFFLFALFSGKQIIYTVEILFIPLSVFFTNYFLKMKKQFIVELFFFILLIIIVIGKFL